MGYRSRLGIAPKVKKAEFSGKTYEQVEAMLGDDMVSPYFPPFHTQLYELGKYCDFDIKPEPFYDFDIMEEAESEFHIIGRDGLKQIIAEYHKNIRDNYEEIREKGEWRDFIEQRFTSWGRNSEAKFPHLPYKLDEDPEKTDGNIVNSWQYEYAIFELVSIYRTFDWDNDYLIYSAW